MWKGISCARYIFLAMAIFSCQSGEQDDSNKDLAQRMMDIKIYQENLGDEIEASRHEIAEWLLEGLDSILLEVSTEIKEHRMLRRPFSYYYRKELRNPISEIRKGIKKRDTALAGKYYRILVNRCDGCHIDNDVDEVVRY